MRLPPIVQPPTPGDQATATEIELWKMALRTYQQKAEERKKNTHQAYALILGQCLQALHNRMETHVNWSIVDTNKSVIGLLEIIQVCMTQRQTRRKPEHSLFDSEVHALTFKQTRNMSNHDYYKKFKDNIEVAERLGGEIGCHSRRVDTKTRRIAVDMLAPTDAEKRRGKVISRDKYLAIAFLANSDKRRYNSLVVDIENDHTKGSNTYPQTLNAAYDYLINYRSDCSFGNDNDEGGLAFYNEDCRDNEPQQGRGLGGRNAGGRSGG